MERYARRRIVGGRRVPRSTPASTTRLPIFSTELVINRKDAIARPVIAQLALKSYKSLKNKIKN
ncbi:MAG: hypothetical protein RIC93_07035 [Alphaproteobacteria bacterium]